MSGRCTVKDVLTPEGVRLLAVITALKSKPYVKVGVLQEGFDRPKDTDGKGANAKPAQFSQLTTLGIVAVANEFGVDEIVNGRYIHIPERSFIRFTHDLNRAKWIKVTDKLREKVMALTMSTDAALRYMGAMIKSAMQSEIRHHIPPPNAPETIEAKGSSTPLIDTGQLINALDYEVHRAGDEDLQVSGDARS